MIKAIYIASEPAWFCEFCRKSSHVMYYEGGRKWCSHCVPQDKKDNAEYFNQIGEKLDKKVVDKLRQ